LYENGFVVMVVLLWPFKIYFHVNGGCFSYISNSMKKFTHLIIHCVSYLLCRLISFDVVFIVVGLLSRNLVVDNVHLPHYSLLVIAK
jgi:hypothetical protein